MTEKDYKKILKDRLIEYRDSLTLDKNITFGIEVEYENIANDTVTYLIDEEKSYNNNLIGWINKTELDIGEYNIIGEEMNGEINSPILVDKIYTWKNLKTLLDILEKKGAIITKKCGGHVNIGAHILENKSKYYRNFFLLWILYEDIIYDFCSGEYSDIRGNIENFIGSISYDINIDKIIDTKRKSYLKTLSDSIFDKSHDIYIDKNFSRKRLLDNVIEFRIPNGTLSKEIWQNYINFFAKFVIACKKELDVEKTLYKIKNKESSAVELADYVFDNNIDKEYFLIQALKTNKIYKKELPEHKYYC